PADWAPLSPRLWWWSARAPGGTDPLLLQVSLFSLLHGAGAAYICRRAGARQLLGSLQCGVTLAPLGHRKAGGQGTYDQGPAVDQHEQHDLERQRDDQRR